MSLCPEFEYRESLSDEDFWAHILANEWAGWADFDESDLDNTTELPIPCSICGEITVCGYDSEGRPMIHVEPDDELSD